MTSHLRLIDVIERLDGLADELTAFTMKPWNATAATILVPEPEHETDVHSPGEGYEYLLEVSIMREVIGAWSVHRDGRQPTVAESCEAVIHYAAWDCYLEP